MHMMRNMIKADPKTINQIGIICSTLHSLMPTPPMTMQAKGTSMNTIMNTVIIVDVTHQFTHLAAAAC